MTFPPYHKYKESGVEWLGEIPAHWELRAIKNLAKAGAKTFTDGDWIEAPFVTNEGVRLIQTGNIGIGVYKEQGFRYISEETFESLQCTEVKPRDVLICRLDGPVGRACLAPDLGVRMITSVDNAILKVAEDIVPEFVVALLSSVHWISWIDALCRVGGGFRLRVSRSQLGELRAPIPPYEEQQAIATFLDRETTKIDALIAEQRRLIELLQEKRQAIISHAVTKGLDPNAPMKDSGIEWLGEIPAHWEVKKLKFICDIRTGEKDTVNAVEDGKYPFFVRSQNIERINTCSFDCEAVLTAGDGVGVGKVYHYYNGPFDFHQRVYMMNNFKYISGLFFYNYIMSNFHKVALDGGAKSTVDSLRLPTFLNFMFTTPTEEEQQTIVAFLDQETRKIDNLISEAEKSIALLQERRTALISAAVTGKIDVRGALAHETLPPPQAQAL